MELGEPGNDEDLFLYVKFPTNVSYHLNIQYIDCLVLWFEAHRWIFSTLTSRRFASPRVLAASRKRFIAALAKQNCHRHRKHDSMDHHHSIFMELQAISRCLVKNSV